MCLSNKNLYHFLHQACQRDTMRSNELKLKLMLPLFGDVVQFTKGNKVIGIGSRHFYQVFYYVLSSFNCTIIPVQIGKDKTCSTFNCDTIIKAYQSGEIDYFPLTSLFPKIYPNTTLGPMASYTSCYIWSRSPKKLTLTSHDFIDTFSNIDENLVNLLLFLLILYVIAFCWLIQMNLIKVTLYLWAIIFKESFGFRRLIKSPSSKLLATKVAIFAFLVEIIFFCYVKTGIISNDSILKVDSFQDLIDAKLTPFLFDYSPCFTSLQHSPIKIEKKIATKITLLSLGDDIEHYPPTEKMVLIADLIAANFFRTYLCIVRKDTMKNHLLYVSKEVLEGPQISVFNLHTPLIVRQRLQSIIYNYYQSGCHSRYKFILSQFLEWLFAQKPSISCLNDFTDKKQDSPTPIPLQYFRKLAIVYLIIIVISINIFACEFLF